MLPVNDGLDEDEEGDEEATAGAVAPVLPELAVNGGEAVELTDTGASSKVSC